MITIYTNQNLNTQDYTIYYGQTQLNIDSNKWWFLYNFDTSTILIQPKQKALSILVNFTVVLSDTLEELNSYIETNNLVLSRGLRKTLNPYINYD